MLLWYYLVNLNVDFCFLYEKVNIMFSIFLYFLGWFESEWLYIFNIKKNLKGLKLSLLKDLDLVVWKKL